MFTGFFYLLRAEGVPVSVTEWMTLMEALSKGMARASLTNFYYLARSILVKSEAYYDKYDVAFTRYFGGIETPEDITEQVMRWVENALPPLNLTPEERERLAQRLEKLDLEELKRRFEERLKEQKEEHHGGSYWIGTGGTSPFGHSGYHPSGLRLGGESHSRSAVKVAAERRYQGYRDDITLGVRQFEVALKRLRRLSTKHDAPKDVLDLEETIKETSNNAGRLKLVFTRPRKNTLKLCLLMDVGGSMTPYSRLCSQLFTAVHRASHFKDIRFYYFHNCVYDRLYLDPMCHPHRSEATNWVLNNLDSEYRLIIVGDATMAPSELTAPGGIIWWGMVNEEPGIVWLQRLRQHFPYSVWLNPIPSAEWDTTYGHHTLNMIRQVFPMYELTLEGLTRSTGSLLNKR